MRRKFIPFVVLVGVVGSACASSQPPASGRVGDLRGRIVHVDEGQGLISVTADAGDQWFKLAPLTEVKGPDISTVDQLEPGQRVYVRYRREPSADPPEILSVTVIKYRRSPKGGGAASLSTGF